MQKKVIINSRLANLRIVENTVDDITGEIGISYNSYGKILVSLLEAVNNAIIHGNNSVAEKVVVVTIRYNRPKLTVKVKDEGKGFSPDTVPDPTKPENIEEANGRGVFIMAKLADEIKYSSKGNCVTMIFNNVIS